MRSLGRPLACSMFALACDHASPLPIDALALAPDLQPRWHEPPSPELRSLPEPQPQPQPQPQPESGAAAPLEVRFAERAMMFRQAPSFDAPFRGKVPRHGSFEVLEHLDGDDPRCKGEGWARLPEDGFACLEHTHVIDEPPQPVEALAPGRLLPRYYARPQTDTPASRYRTRIAMRRNDTPIDSIGGRRIYSFVTRKRTRGHGWALIDERRRAVAESEVKPLKPSAFAGRDLRDKPVPDGFVLAWTIAWPHTEVVAANPTGRRLEIVQRLPFHTAFLVKPGTRRHRGTTYLERDDGQWVDARRVRTFTVGPALPQAGEDELWLDVDIDQQTLAIMRGDTAQFATLISSGTGKDPTPAGLYRMESKHGLTDMRSRPSDAEDDEYHVEDVPWVQYFDGRYGLHAAYWHGRFGHRTSHGCINLSPRDAKRVFEATRLKLPAGWLSMYESPDDPGTLIRVRRGDAPVKDRRHEPYERR